MVFSVHDHASPTLLTALLVPHPEVLHAHPLALNAGNGEKQQGIVTEVEIFSMPRLREEIA